jgi:hypothetical protein
MGFDCTNHRCQYPDAGTVYCMPGAQATCGCVGDPEGGTQTCDSTGQMFGMCIGCPP